MDTVMQVVMFSLAVAIGTIVGALVIAKLLSNWIARVIAGRLW